jgi:hypothetical protein
VVVAAGVDKVAVAVVVVIKESSSSDPSSCAAATAVDCTDAGVADIRTAVGEGGDGGMALVCFGFDVEETEPDPDFASF